ncbi:MipA/OmpV family protein [Yoonia sp.]|uniref:MipA/OmpV family protein n=1 Tax=Yoonia sp. TaxID=2212373 RepID=UPI003F6A59DD
MLIRMFTIITAISAGQTLSAQDGGNGISAHIGVGAQVKPGYFGSDEMVVGPTGSFQLERLQLGGVTIGGAETKGFGFGGSVRFISERTADEFDELAGLDTIDASVELGGGVRYYGSGYDLFADLRSGVIGHDSLVGEIGGDLIYQPSAQVTLRAGPRVFWGSDDYAQTYFGITADEAANSSFVAYDAQGGILSAGVKAEAHYQFNEDWGLTGTIRYDQLQGDATNSPIVQTTDQVGASVVLTRKVTFGF